MTITRHNLSARMSQVVELPPGKTLVFLAGQTADDASQDVAGQTADVLAKIDKLLAAGGATKAGLISATIWLADIGDFDRMNPVWERWIDASNPPVRACVEGKLANPRLSVEIQVTAAK